MKTAAILLAAGSGKRMKGAVRDKILAPLGGRPVFAHSVEAFVASGVANFHVIACRDEKQMRALAGHAPEPSVLIRGGRDRQDSVLAALRALPSDIRWVFIHDCARPLVRPEQLRALARKVKATKAVVLAHRVTDTIKRRSGNHLRDLDRRELWAMETPQVFSRELITRAYERVAAERLRVTDDAAAVEALGKPVAVLENTLPNPKLTTPADLKYIEALQ